MLLMTLPVPGLTLFSSFSDAGPLTALLMTVDLATSHTHTHASSPPVAAYRPADQCHVRRLEFDASLERLGPQPTRTRRHPHRQLLHTDLQVNDMQWMQTDVYIFAKATYKFTHTPCKACDTHTCRCTPTQANTWAHTHTRTPCTHDLTLKYTHIGTQTHTHINVHTLRYINNYTH